MEYINNIKKYKTFNIFYSLIFIWPIIVPFFKLKGLLFIDIMCFYSIISVITLILEVPTGYLSDCLGHKVVIFGGVLFKIISIYLLLFIESRFIFVCCALSFAIADSLLSGSISALLYESLLRSKKEDDYIKIIRSTRATSMTILALVSLISSVLYELNPSLPIIATCVSMTISLFYVMSFINIKAEGNKESNKNRLSVSYLKSSFKRLIPLILIVILSICYNIVFSNMNFFAQEYMTVNNISYRYFGVVFFANNITSAFFIKYGNIVIKKLKDFSLLYMTLALILIVLGIKFIPITAFGIVMFALMRIVSATVLPELNKKTNQNITSSYRATALSIINGVVSLVTIPADLFIGYSIDKNGVYSSMSILVIFSLLAFSTLVLIAYRDKDLPSKEYKYT